MAKSSTSLKVSNPLKQLKSLKSLKSIDLKKSFMSYVTKEHIIIFLLLLLIVISIFHFFKKNTIESFDIASLSKIVIDNNTSDNTSTSGTIKFTQTFKTIPVIFTQIVGNEGNTPTSTDVYSVQILNITLTSFDYIKTKIFKKTNATNTIAVATLDNTTLPFNWIAFQI